MQKEKNPVLCSHCCVRLFTLIDSSAPPRQVPQISDSDSCWGNWVVALCYFGYVDSPSRIPILQEEDQLTSLGAGYFLNREE